MRRLLLVPVALLGLATLGLASASALTSTHQANAASVGKIARLSSSSITIRSKTKPALSCRVTSYSPGIGPFALGDRVRIACASHVLVAIADIPSSTRKSTNEGATITGISGAITALGSSSITVHDGDRNLICSIDPGSPATSGFAVGDHVKIYCANGVLASIGPVTNPPPPPTTTTTTSPTVTSANGPITALTPGSISVQTMTCSVGPGSPATSGFAIGSPVRMYCENGVLSQLKHSDETPPPTTTTTTTTTTHNETPPTTTTTVPTTTTTPQVILGLSGTITALGSSITAVSSGGTDGPNTLTCTLGAGTPSTAGFAVGSAVRIYCLNGALYQLKHNDSPPPTTTSTTTATTTTTTTSTPPGTYTQRNGTLSALGSSSITVSSGDGSLTCSLTGNSPSLSGFAVGNSVRMYCLNGALYTLAHQ